MRDPFDRLTASEFKDITDSLFRRWECPIDRGHYPPSHYDDCFGCSTLCLMTLIDVQDEVTNDITWIARGILSEFFEQKGRGE